jgi:hypothetical protein
MDLRATFPPVIDIHFQYFAKKRESRFSAIRTETIEFQPMAFNIETMFPGNFVLKLFDAFIFKFNNLAAGKTDQVIMMFIMVAGFVASLAIPEMTLFRDAAFGKKLQSAMDGRITDVRVSAAQAQVQVLRRQVGSGTQELFQNQLSLPGRFQPLA